MTVMDSIIASRTEEMIEELEKEERRKRKMKIREKITCKHCEYVWMPRIEQPKCCPRCKQYIFLREGAK